MSNMEFKDSPAMPSRTFEASPLFQQVKEGQTERVLSEYDSSLAQKDTPDVVKTVKATTEFGKVGKAIEIEQVCFGRLDTGDCGGQISFGSLASGEFKKNKNYLRWKDGIDVGEVNKGWIKELANEIAAIYGNDNIKVSKRNGMDNAGINTYLGQLVYDPNFLRKAGNDYGMDSILGTLAHEVGHRVVYNIGLEDEITPYENEACADYIAGLTARLCKLDGTHQLDWYSDHSEVSLDGIHPGKSVRMEAFTRGLTRIDNGKEAIRLKAFEVFSPYDLEGVYQDANTLKSILYQDVILPLRTGEIKKV